MRHDLATKFSTARDVLYSVAPCAPQPAPFVAPVVLTIDARGPIRVQDYLTVDEAERLARDLLDGARKARELADDEPTSAPAAEGSA